MRAVWAIMGWFLAVSSLSVCHVSVAADETFNYTELARLELKFEIMPKSEKMDANGVRERLLAIEQKLHIVSFDDDLQGRLKHAKKLSEDLVNDYRGFAQPTELSFQDWYDFLARFSQLERELKLEPKGLITDRLKKIEKKLGIKSPKGGEFYPRAKEAVRKYLQIMSAHYPGPSTHCEAPSPGASQPKIDESSHH